MGSELNENWDLEIKPKRSLFSLNVRELLQYKDLIFLFVKRDFVAQFKQTILGPLWHIIQPILTTAVFLLLFGRIAKLGTDGIPGPLFYISGITVWTYFSSCLTATAGTFLANAGIFGKVYFPRLVMPLSVTVSNLIKLMIQLALVLLMMVYYHYNGFVIDISLNWLLLPLIVMVLAGTSLGLGIIISSLTTKYRDLSFLLTFAVQLGMYATPIAYPHSFVADGDLGRALALNPLTWLVEAFRFCLFGHGVLSIDGLLYSFVFMLISLGLGVLLFNKVESTFMDTV